MARPSRITAVEIEEYTGKGYWTDITVADLWERNALAYPDKGALADSRACFTWSQAKEWVDRMALALLDLGFARDEVLAMQLPPSADLFMLRVACEEAGVIAFPLAPQLRHHEMGHVLRSTEARGLIIPREFRGFDHFAMARDLQPEVPTLRLILVTDQEAPPGAVALPDLAARPPTGPWRERLARSRCPSLEFCLILPTTGTTGLFKLVEHPLCSRVYAGLVYGRALGLTGEDTLGVITYAGGLNLPAYFGAPWWASKVATLEHFTPEDTFAFIERERVTVLVAVPAQLAMMVQVPNIDRFDLSSLRLVQSGGAHLSYQTALEVEEKFGCPVLQTYGTTDCGVCATGTFQDPPHVRLRTVGRPLEGNAVKLMGPEGREVVEGEVGEIWIKGPTLASGYYRNPEATRQNWTEDGWYKTGDLGRLDEEGYLLLMGRKEEDLIIRGGQNIYVPEVENLLAGNPKVAAVALVGMPDAVMGERACAYVVPKPGRSLTLDELTAFLRQQGVAAYKWPERLEIIAEFPLVGGQKVDKKALHQDLLQKLAAKG
ncbi:MAG TPA: AMP-binding protein [Dehalococcoidia bacterium]|nr:AMP-binding protein [Dehalococcoidia bacterium]